MDLFQNLAVFSVAIAIAGIGLLGFTIYFNDKESVTNRSLFIFSFVTVIWSILNYFQFSSTNPQTSLWLLRLVIFVGAWHSFSFFIFGYVFPKRKKLLPWWIKFIILPLLLGTSILNLTPLVFREVINVSVEGKILSVQNGPALPIFGTMLGFLVLGGLFFLSRKTIKARGRERQQLKTVLWGILITFLLLMGFNFLLPAFFETIEFIPLGAVFLLPFVLFTAYSIKKYNLFKVKIATIAFLVFTLSVAVSIELIFSNELSELLLKIGEFLLVLIVGTLLIRGVTKEVTQREQIQKLAGDLEIANQEQQNLIHFITHQVKGFITKSRNIFASIQEEDYGPMPKEIQPLIKEGFRSDTKAVETVQEILQASNLRKGTIEYAEKTVDVTQIVTEHIEKQKPIAEKKGLVLESNIDEGEISLIGDAGQLEHVIHNLIDNAVKYTLTGSVIVSLSKDTDHIRFSVKDTGIGITEEDRKRLFTEGGRGKNSQKVNVESTGYGLFIVKNIVEKHGGKVWAESAGEGKGSEFVVELPLKGNHEKKS